MVCEERKSVLRRACGAAAGTLAVAWCLLGTAEAETLIERTNRGLVELLTSGADDTATRTALDLADILDDGATRRILPVLGRGSTQNLVDLKALRGIDVAIVQTDVLEHARKQKSFPGLANAITYIAKLYNEELHVLAPAATKGIAELAGRKVDFAGTAAVTGPAVFDFLGIKVEPSFDEPAIALAKLRSGDIAALVYVAGKPASLPGAPSAQQGMHFLAVPLKSEMAASYVPARLTAADYPGLVPAEAPVDTVAVGTVMAVAALQPGTERYRNVVNFVDAFFTQFPRLQEAPHHPKWQEVNLAAELPGWKRFPPADAWLRRNLVASAAPDEQALRQIFAKFLDEHNRLSGGPVMTAEQKAGLFDQFLRWQQSSQAR